MNEENEQPSEAPAEETTETQDTNPLDQAYGEAGVNVDEEAQQFTATPQNAEPQYEDPYLDDQQFNQLRGEIQQSVQEVHNLKANLENQQNEADLNKAIEYIGTKVDGISPKLIDAYLNAEAKEDPRLLKVWNARKSNPTALNKVLDAMSQKISKDFEVREDAQLAENQRAAQQSQQTMATSSHNQSDDKYDGMSLADVDKEIEAIRNSGM